MRIALVAHGLPPAERTGVETHVAALARLLGRAGHRVSVLAPRRAQRAHHLALAEEQREGHRVHWLELVRAPARGAETLDPPGAAEVVGAWLDRERPDVVHVHHVAKLGLGAIEETVRRGVPTVVTAHDYWPVCHRLVLLRPDLTRCETVGDAELCARCDRATALLDGLEGLGDWQAGVAPEDLAPAARSALEAILDGAEGPPAADVEERARLDARRRDVLASADVVLCPTRHLARRLAEGGLPPERLVVRPYAIETAELARLAPPTVDGSRPLRVGYLGGLAKHKGVGVLLEALARTAAPVELFVWGATSDAEHARRLRRLALQAGAAWRGPYDAGELPRVLSEVDAVAVPSTWVENAPFVIREAFAARRPVLASRTPALEESVRDGVDGLLVEAGDADAWARALERLADPATHARLVAGVEPPPELEREVVELVELYSSLTARTSDATTEVPAHLAPFAARFARLAALPSAELLVRVTTGLDELGRALAPDRTAGSRWPAALARAVGARERVAAAERESAWLRGALDARERGERAQAERADWLEGVVSARERERDHEGRRAQDSEAARDAVARELEWLRGVLRARDDELAAARAELEDRARAVGALERERAWLTQGRDAAGRERDALREALDAARAALAEGERERDWLRGLRRGLEGERDELGSALGDARRERDWLRELRGDLEREAAWLRDARDTLGVERDWLRDVRAALEGEVAWRREQMDAARAEAAASRLRALLARSPLGRRLRAWAEEPS